MIHKLYAIVLTHNLGPSKGKTGYHSIWTSEDTALRYASKLNKLYSREFSYKVISVSSTEHFKSHSGTQVKLPNSIGYMHINFN